MAGHEASRGLTGRAVPRGRLLEKRFGLGNILRITKFVIGKAVAISVMIFVCLLIAVILANSFGWWDNFQRDLIRRQVLRELFQRADYDTMTQAERDLFVQQRTEEEIKAAGLDENFLLKSMREAWRIMTLDLGEARRLRTTDGSYWVRDIVMERFPRTALMFTSGTLLGAGLGIRVGLRVVRKALTVEDRAVSVTSMVLSAAPSWVWGIFLMLLFGLWWPILPLGGLVGVPAPLDPVGFYLDALYHMILPLAAIAIATFGVWAYATRNLCLQILSDDYVEAAKVRGLPNRVVMRRYVLRAASPPIVTSLSLALVNSLSGSIILETWFGWPGLGYLLWDAIGPYCSLPCVDVAVIMGIVAIYAYLTAITVFVLDVVYALLDPRIKSGRAPLGRKGSGAVLPAR